LTILTYYYLTLLDSSSTFILSYLQVMSQPEQSIDQLAFEENTESETPLNTQAIIPLVSNPAPTALNIAIESIRPHLAPIIQHASEPNNRVGRISEAVHLSLALILGVYARNQPTSPYLTLRFYTISTHLRPIIDIISIYQRGEARLALLATVLNQLWSPVIESLANIPV